MTAHPIYLDHHATTPLDPRVLDAMQPYLREEFGNAASVNHVYGWRAEGAVEDARERIAARLGADPREIVFTSGATESNNLAILGHWDTAPQQIRHWLCPETEHPAVLDPMRALARRGQRVDFLSVDAEGRVDPDQVERALADDTALVSVMAANNEIGTIQPIREIAALCRARGVLFHTDAAQAVGKIPLHFAADGLDLLSLSGHKLYGPKGVGALVVRSGRPRVKLEPRQYGGGHERGLRSGTLPVAAIVGLARALELCCEEREKEAERLAALRERLFEALEGALDGVLRNGSPDAGLPGNLNVSFEGVDGERVLLALHDVAVSSGSACSSASPEPSHVLAAIGRPPALARASIRFGLGRGTTEAEIDRAAARVIEVVKADRALR